VPDIFIMDATKTFPFRDGQLQFIYSEDFIEHFLQKEGLAICAECFRVLTPGGVLRLSTPGFDKILSEMKPRSREGVQFGHWKWGHKLLYTRNHLQFLLEGCGFSRLNFCLYGESEYPELRNIDTRENQKYLNIFVEAIK
jgi:predicted SAM-dependent methyltransferase